MLPPITFSANTTKARTRPGVTRTGQLRRLLDRLHRPVKSL